MIISQDLIDMHEWEKRAFSPPSPMLIKKHLITRHGLSNATWLDTNGHPTELTQHAASCFPVVLLINNQNPAAKMDIKENIISHYGTTEAVLNSLLQSLTGNLNIYAPLHVASQNHNINEAINNITSNKLLPIEKMKKRLNTFKIFIDNTNTDQQNATEENWRKCSGDLVDWARLHNLQWFFEHNAFILTSPPPANAT